MDQHETAGKRVRDAFLLGWLHAFWWNMAMVKSSEGPDCFYIPENALKEMRRRGWVKPRTHNVAVPTPLGKVAVHKMAADASFNLQGDPLDGEDLVFPPYGESIEIPEVWADE